MRCNDARSDSVHTFDLPSLYSDPEEWRSSIEEIGTWLETMKIQSVDTGDLIMEFQAIASHVEQLKTYLQLQKDIGNQFQSREEINKLLTKYKKHRQQVEFELRKNPDKTAQILGDKFVDSLNSKNYEENLDERQEPIDYMQQILENQNKSYKKIVQRHMDAAIVEVDGKNHELTANNFTKLQKNQDSRVRKKTYSELMSSYAEMSDVLYPIFESQVIAASESSLTQPPILQAQSELGIPDNFYRIINNNIGLISKPIKARFDKVRQTHNLKSVSQFDRRLPLTSGWESEISIPKCKSLIQEAIGKCSEKVKNIVHAALHDGWIDFLEHNGKRSGACCRGLYNHHPFILVNYCYDVYSVLQVAHEIGHAVHYELSRSENSFVHYRPHPIVEEISSLTFELLVTQHMMASDEQNCFELGLYHQAELVQNYLLDNIAFLRFKQHLYSEIQQDGEIPKSTINKIFARELKETAQIEDVPFKNAWMKQHRVLNDKKLLKYSYNFLIAMVLQEKIRNGKCYIFDGLMKTGSSTSSGAVLAKIDISTNSDELIESISGELDRLASHYETYS